jgi:tRNA U34 5-methylaminomethyl-2-thiouridine-forming methyltransferase MnmC
MERLIQLTRDGSHTIAIPALDVTFHSIHGAIQESTHVFIDAALRYTLAKPELHAAGTCLNILEMGFGTGLNALLTLQEVIGAEREVYYQSVEQYPLTPAETKGLNYAAQLGDAALEPYLAALHSSAWNQDIPLHPCLTLHKSHTSLEQLTVSRLFHMIYYDAFAPRAQPELWTTEIFEKLIGCLLPGGILVTYCSKSVVRRAMQAAGFEVVKIPGPYGKREMLRAIKPISLV